ncbi:hypothetical protein [Viscerimonas tarda]
MSDWCNTEYSEANKEYIRLIAEQKRISNAIYNLIIAALKENNGKITFTEGLEDDWDSDYPVTSTFWSNKDNPNIDITDVYLDENDRVFVDGYNSHNGVFETRLEVETGQYSDVLDFIGAVSGWKNANDEEQDTEQVSVTIIFGTEAVREYEDSGEIPSEEWLEANGGVVDEKTFKSQGLMNAYLEGLNDADGWLDTLVLDEFMIDLLKKKGNWDYN